MLMNIRLNKLRVSLGLGIIFTLLAGFNSTTLAQFQDDNSGYQSNEKDAIYGDAPAGLNPLDLMHRIQQANGRSDAEFSQESQVQLNNSASDFKLLQQQRILEQQQNPTNTQEESPETLE